MINKIETMRKCADYFIRQCQTDEITAGEMFSDIEKMFDWLPAEIRRNFYCYSFETQWKLYFQQWIMNGHFFPYTSDLLEFARYIFGEFDTGAYLTDDLREMIGECFAIALMPSIYDHYVSFID